MIQIICGKKGSGKTKIMLDKATEYVKSASGEVVYVDKSAQNMYELNNQVRLINISEYPVSSTEAFLGFVSGLLSGNHDIECVFFDSLLKLAKVELSELKDFIDSLEKLSEDKTFILSVSSIEEDLPSDIKDKILVSC